MSGFHIQDGEVIKTGIWVGDVIEFRGTRYKILKEKQVNWLIQDEAGKQYNLRIGTNVTKSENQEWAGPKEKTEYEKYMESITAGITLGTVVEFIAANLASKYPGRYVCIAMPNDGTLRVAKLGGDGGSYLRKITATEVRVISVDEL